jgi:hypothetical protein
MYTRLNETIDLLCSQIDASSDIRPYVQLTRRELQDYSLGQVNLEGWEF